MWGWKNESRGKRIRRNGDRSSVVVDRLASMTIAEFRDRSQFVDPPFLGTFSIVAIRYKYICI